MLLSESLPVSHRSSGSVCVDQVLRCAAELSQTLTTTGNQMSTTSTSSPSCAEVLNLNNGESFSVDAWKRERLTQGTTNSLPHLTCLRYLHFHLNIAPPRPVPSRLGKVKTAVKKVRTSNFPAHLHQSFRTTSFADSVASSA